MAAQENISLSEEECGVDLLPAGSQKKGGGGGNYVSICYAVKKALHITNALLKETFTSIMHSNMAISGTKFSQQGG